MEAELRRRLRTRQRDKGYDLYEDDPVGFIRDILNDRPWSIQETIARAVVDYPAVAVPSCFGSGKDWIAGRIVAWWVATGGIAITTADTHRQLSILWKELRRAVRAGELPGRMLPVDHRWDVSDGVFAWGFKPDDNNPEGFQGIHGQRVLTVYDEANGISPALFEAGLGLAVTPRDRRLAIGNPHEPSGPFFEVCSSATWHVIPVSVYDTPNFTGEPVDPKAADELVSPYWVEERRKDGLEDTPWWSAKILGQFPDSASNAIIPLSFVEAARALAHVPDAKEYAGLDVARFGTDDTVLVESSGNGPESVSVVHGHDLMAVAGMGANYLRARRGTLAIDGSGVGGGVVDRLREQRLAGAILDVNAGAAPDNDPDDRFLNLRAQMWWHVRDALRDGEVSLARLSEQEYQRLRAELTGPTYKFNSSGKVIVESKDDMRKRGLPSPDLADAFNLSIYARSRARRRVASFGAVA